jgi:DNA repair protein RadD
MALKLRPYQATWKDQIYRAWRDGHQNVLAILPTGLGKTKCFCAITIDLALGEPKYPTAIIVHRKELLQQISLTLAEEEIPHNLIAPRSVILGIVGAHRRMYRKQFYDYNAPITVVSVDTLNARILKHEKWAKSIRLWITDEAAHLLKNNKWGRAVQYFPNAVGLGVTATPRRLDKKGLGRHADGVFDVMVEGPGVRWGMDNGFLCKYKIAIPSSDYRHFLRKASDGADFSKEAMVEASQKSRIVGDVVHNYQKFANGKQAILFASDIATGNLMEAKFKSAGISAKLLTGMSDDKERLDAMIDYRDKKIKVLLNVDLFDEGLDVPGIECVIHARPTMSVSKYCQMNGRGLRPAENKSHLIIIDHVGNVITHGLPCQPRKWTLDRIVKKRDKTNFIRICSNVECNAPYDRTLTACPWCGTEAVVGGGMGGGRVPPKEVDGDLHLIDSDTLHELEKAAILPDPAVVAKRVGFAAGPGAAHSAMKHQVERIKTQKDLVHAIAKWAGEQRGYGYSDRQIHKLFYLQHERTISECLSEPRAEMLKTMEDLGE